LLGCKAAAASKNFPHIPGDNLQKPETKFLWAFVKFIVSKIFTAFNIQDILSNNSIGAK
jgi:hypothetical protein